VHRSGRSFDNAPYSRPLDFFPPLKFPPELANLLIKLVFFGLNLIRLPLANAFLKELWKPLLCALLPLVNLGWVQLELDGRRVPLTTNPSTSS
jgi:hypothetical protein